MSIVELVHALVCTPHPDDAEFGVAGTVAKWVKEGKEPWVSRELTAAEQRAYKELEEENGNT